MMLLTNVPWLCRSLVPLGVVLAVGLSHCAGTSVDFSVPHGFEISLYADDELAHDIYSLTIDSQGRAADLRWYVHGLTSRGNVISGLVIYESADGLTLRDFTNQTLRIESTEIDTRRELPTSLMPTGLLDNLQPQDLADLYAYLQTL